MPRMARIFVKGEELVYHIISRTALEGYVIEEADKDYFVELLKHLSQVYFVEVMGFSIMGNHFHLVVRMKSGEGISDEEIRQRFDYYYNKDGKETENVLALAEDQISSLRQKWSDLSEYVKDIKQRFSRYYNKKHNRKGYFWSDRFKSLLVEEGDTLINCLAYVELNACRAGLVKKPEDYRWCSLGYHVQTGNRDGFLSLHFGLPYLNADNPKERLRHYREFVYEKGGITIIDEDIVEKEKERNFEISSYDRFLYRTRYFTDSGIIGSKEFVKKYYQKFKNLFTSKEKEPKSIKGLKDIFSLKRLSETF
jgi:putative transposase